MRGEGREVLFKLALGESDSTNIVTKVIISTEDGLFNTTVDISEPIKLLMRGKEEIKYYGKLFEDDNFEIYPGKSIN